MRFVDQLRRIERIDQLIRLKATGTPTELALKLGLSESQLFEVLSLMKNEFGAPIRYSKASRCYYYKSSKRFICKFEDDLN
jgi:hypothetical protein